MVKCIDPIEREEKILSLIAKSYIKESKPISSAYLCRNCHLSYSSATVRHIMFSLERQGFLSNVYTSSGRVPTKKGFKKYVENFCESDFSKDLNINLDFYSLPVLNMDGVINYTLDSLSRSSGYTSLIAVSGKNEKVFFKGMRCILDQPEFEDIRKLKDIFYVLESKLDVIYTLLFNCIDKKIKILIGDDIGFDEFCECSLIISGVREKHLDFVLALLGPIRMNYAKATSCLNSANRQLKEIAVEFA